MDAVCADNTAVPWSAAGQGGAPPTPLEVKCNAARRDSRRVCKVPRFCGLRFAQPHCRMPIPDCALRFPLSPRVLYHDPTPTGSQNFALFLNHMCIAIERGVCHREATPRHVELCAELHVPARDLCSLPRHEDTYDQVHATSTTAIPKNAQRASTSLHRHTGAASHKQANKCSAHQSSGGYNSIWTPLHACTVSHAAPRLWWPEVW